MKIDELINKLEVARREYGNQDVYLDVYGDIVGIDFVEVFVASNKAFDIHIVSTETP